jgi:hypothetical protein
MIQVHCDLESGLVLILLPELETDMMQTNAWNI